MNRAVWQTRDGTAFERLHAGASEIVRVMPGPFGRQPHLAYTESRSQCTSRVHLPTAARVTQPCRYRRRAGMSNTRAPTASRVRRAQRRRSRLPRERAIKPSDERGPEMPFGAVLVHNLDRCALEATRQASARNAKRRYHQEMFARLERRRLCHLVPRARICVIAAFGSFKHSQVEAYADDIMDARIADLPCGTVRERYRLFEAWRYGLSSCGIGCRPSFLEGLAAPFSTRPRRKSSAH